MLNITAHSSQVAKGPALNFQKFAEAVKRHLWCERCYQEFRRMLGSQPNAQALARRISKRLTDEQTHQPQPWLSPVEVARSEHSFWGF